MSDVLSVIIPVYNQEKYLNRCLYSVCKQTYKDMEIIIIDDGSSDSSRMIINDFLKKDKRCVCYYTDNKGLSMARNLGLSMAKGNLIAFLDSDDFIDTDMYETLIRNLNGSGADISICGYYKYIDGVEKAIMPSYDNKITILNREDALIKLYTSQMESFVWNRVYKKELFTDITFPKNTTREDIYIMYKLFNKANLIVYQDTPKYYFTQRKNQIIADKCDKNCIDYLTGLVSRYNAVKNSVDLEIKKQMLANIYSEYVEQNTEENKENALFFVKNLLLIENLDFKEYLSPLKRKQLYLRRMGISYSKQYKIINLIKRK